MRTSNPGLAGMTRRHWLRTAGAVVGLYANAGWLGALAADAAHHPQRRRSCILLWMNGGPGDDRPLGPQARHTPTAVPSRRSRPPSPGLQIGEHLPKMAAVGDRLASSARCPPRRATTAGRPISSAPATCRWAPIQFPTLGSLVAKELADAENGLPPIRQHRPAARAGRPDWHSAPASSARSTPRSLVGDGQGDGQVRSANAPAGRRPLKVAGPRPTRRRHAGPRPTNALALLQRPGTDFARRTADRSDRRQPPGRLRPRPSD